MKDRKRYQPTIAEIGVQRHLSLVFGHTYADGGAKPGDRYIKVDDIYGLASAKEARIHPLKKNLKVEIDEIVFGESKIRLKEPLDFEVRDGWSVVWVPVIFERQRAMVDKPFIDVGETSADSTSTSRRRVSDEEFGNGFKQYFEQGFTHNVSVSFWGDKHRQYVQRWSQMRNDPEVEVRINHLRAGPIESEFAVDTELENQDYIRRTTLEHRVNYSRTEAGDFPAQVIEEFDIDIGIAEQ